MPYTGGELSSHWIYRNWNIQGDALVAFVGPVDVPLTAMVDLADQRDGLSIQGKCMLHFVLESFGPDLDRAVFLQRLLVFLLFEQVQRKVGDRLRRQGDDLFVDDGKLSVSIATVSPVSSLIHLGINVTNEGTPVKTAALSDCGLEAEALARQIMKACHDELAAMALASTKVRGVQ